MNALFLEVHLGFWLPYNFGFVPGVLPGRARSSSFGAAYLSSGSKQGNHHITISGISGGQTSRISSHLWKSKFHHHYHHYHHYHLLLQPAKDVRMENTYKLSAGQMSHPSWCQSVCLVSQSVGRSGGWRGVMAER